MEAQQIRNENHTRFGVLTAIIALTLYVAAVPLWASTVHLDLAEDYGQFSTAAPTSPGSFAIAFFYNQTIGEFTSASLTYPGPGSPQTLPTSGTQPVFNPGAFSTLSALQSAYPFGTYTFNFSNGSTMATGSISYTQNLFATTIPAFAAGTVTGLQDMNSVSPFTLSFNTFTPNPSLSNPAASTTVTIGNPATGLQVFNSGQLSDSTTSAVIPGGVLMPNTTYTADLIFNNNNSVDTGFNESTFLTFTTANALNVQGGTSSSPVFLFSSQPVGQVTGTIAGQGAEDYYSFLWSGGNFDATASVTGASNVGSYLFTEGITGTCSNVDSVTLNSSNSFSGTISVPNLAPGQYCIGIDANSPADPSFTLTFNTPVGGAPEPSAFLLFATGLSIIRVIRRGKDRRKLARAKVKKIRDCRSIARRRAV